MTVDLADPPAQRWRVWSLRCPPKILQALAGKGKAATALGAGCPVLGPNYEGIAGKEHGQALEQLRGFRPGQAAQRQHRGPLGTGSRGSHLATPQPVLWPWAVLVPHWASVSKSEALLRFSSHLIRPIPTSEPLHWLSWPPGMLFPKPAPSPLQDSADMSAQKGQLRPPNPL